MQNQYPNNTQETLNRPVDGVEAEYRQDLTLAREEYSHAASIITSDYQSDLKDMLRGGYSAGRFQESLDKPGQELSGATTTVVAMTDSIIYSYSREFEDLIPAHSLPLWRTIQQRVLIGGIRDEKAQKYLEMSGTSRQAMKGALDAQIWHDIKVAAAAYGADGAKTKSLLASASSFEARNTMETALNAQIWPDLKHRVAVLGMDNERSQALLNKVPSSSRGAMRSALDASLWKDIQRKARTEDTGTIRQSLSQASCFDATELMRSVLTSRQRQEARRPNNLFQDSDYANFVADALSGHARGERTSSWQRWSKGGRERQRTATSSAPSAAETRAAQLANEAVAIINKTVAKDTGLSWLKTMDTADITRVINTVQQLRTKTTEQGKQLTDKEVFLKYRRAVEVPPTEVNPQVLQSYKILDALMGGVKGTLPF